MRNNNIQQLKHDADLYAGTFEHISMSFTTGPEAYYWCKQSHCITSLLWRPYNLKSLEKRIRSKWYGYSFVNHITSLLNGEG